MRKIRSLIRKQQVSQEQLEAIRVQSEAAKEILGEPRFAFLLEYLNSRQESIKEVFATHSIEDAWQELPRGNVMTKIFFPAKKEYSHLSGEYKFISQFLADLQVFAGMYEELMKKIEDKVVEVND